jgi:hypothetical protein
MIGQRHIWQSTSPLVVSGLVTTLSVLNCLTNAFLPG